MDPSTAEIQPAVNARFGRIDADPGQEAKFPVGPASAMRLGYDPQEIDAMPAGATAGSPRDRPPAAINTGRPAQG